MLEREGGVEEWRRMRREMGGLNGLYREESAMAVWVKIDTGEQKLKKKKKKKRFCSTRHYFSILEN